MAAEDLSADDARAALLALKVQQFLYDEAALLDARKFDEWLQLFAPDAVYEVRTLGTVGKGTGVGKAPEPATKVLTKETRDFLTVRVARLERGLASCEMPASLTRRFISNVRVDHRDDGVLSICSNVAIF